MASKHLENLPYRMLPEMCWWASLIFYASNLESDGWSDPWANPSVPAFAVALVLEAIWSIHWRLQENHRELFYSLLYMAASAGLIAIQNSDWTRLALALLLAGYIVGRHFRFKNAARKDT